MIGMTFKFVPLRFSKLHALPVVVPCFVLPAELYPPRLARCALGRGNVCLKFDTVSSGSGDGIDKGVGHTETTVVGLRDFTDNQAGFRNFRLPIADFEFAHWN